MLGQSRVGHRHSHSGLPEIGMSTQPAPDETSEQIHSFSLQAPLRELTVFFDPLLRAGEGRIIDDPGDGDDDPLRTRPLDDDGLGPSLLGGLTS